MKCLPCILTTVFCLLINSLDARTPEIDRIDPPFWYAGFSTTELQIMVHGRDIADLEVKLDYPGVELNRLVKTRNPNYLFVYLDVSSSVHPGTIELQFSSKKKKITKMFELKERNEDLIGWRGLTSDDFLYLVFPDRFANGNPDNDVIEGMNEGSVNRDSMFYRHGGDIQGIIDHLEYFDELGVTGLWINPLIENDQPKESYHGYAATDVYRIDPRFGSMDEYLHLSEEASVLGIKMVMDVVLNHWGNEHHLIKDLPDQNWLNNWDEFTRTSYRAPTLLDPYAAESDKKIMSNGWFDHHMPDLNQKNPLVADYLTQNTIWWIETAGIHALRVDTYAYPDQLFMKRWAEDIKTEYPDLTIFGETWVHGSPIQGWFVDDSHINREFDSSLESVTDFQLYYAINKSLTEDEGWTEGSARLYYTLAKDVIYDHPEKLVTFVDNHDLSRFYSMVNEDFDSWKMGMGFLLTTRGIPCIYYGSEILMKNYADPDGKVREDFPGGWTDDPVNKFEASGRTDKEQEAFEFIKKLGMWRLGNTSTFVDEFWESGKLKHYVPKDGVYVYFRHGILDDLMVVMNFNRKSIELDLSRFNESLGEGLDGENYGENIISGASEKLTGTMTLEPRSIRLISFDLF